MSPLARKVLIAFGLLGLIASSAATYVHYNLIRNPDYSSFCDINSTVSCKAAYLSRYGAVAGVPVAVGGVIFFAWVLLMLWAARGRSRIADSTPAYLFAGSTLALAFVLYLAYASFFILKEVCPLCVATYVAVIGVFIISGGASSVPISSLPRRMLTDMRVLVATPLALVIALLFAAAAAWSVTQFPSETIHASSAEVQTFTAEQQAELARWWDLQPASATFPIANDGAKVVIVEFADFQCPQCKVMYIGLKPVLADYAANRDVRFEFRHWPISSLCNPSVGTPMHPAACDAAAAYAMAKSKGTSDALKDWFFLHQDELSPTTVRRIAAETGRIADFDAQYEKAMGEVKTDAAVGSSIGVSSTPSFFVNGKRIPGGGLPPEYFKAIIELELKKAGR